MSLKVITFKKILVPGLLEQAKRLPTSGQLATDDNLFTCLKIDDDYIHKLYPYFQAINPLITKPDYFGDDLMGAHITVIYPQENTVLESEDIGAEHSFSIQEAFTADLGLKRYYGLTVKANALTELRRKYQLGKKLQFKRYLVDMHITIGTIIISEE